MKILIVNASDRRGARAWIEDAISRLPSEERSSWAELHEEQMMSGSGPYDIADSAGSWTPEQSAAVERSIVDLCFATDCVEASMIIHACSPKIMCALSCMISSSVLHLVREDLRGPRIAIETARAWIRGQATLSDTIQACRDSVRDFLFVRYDMSSREAELQRTAAKSAYVTSSMDATYNTVMARTHQRCKEMSSDWFWRYDGVSDRHWDRYRAEDNAIADRFEKLFDAERKIVGEQMSSLIKDAIDEVRSGASCAPRP